MSFVPTATVVLNQWVRILGALEKKINRQSFETWLKPTRFSRVIGKTLYVRIPSSDFEHIGDKYGQLIDEAIDQLELELESVVFETPAQDPAAPKMREDGGFAPVPSHSANAPGQNTQSGSQAAGVARSAAGSRARMAARPPLGGVAGRMAQAAAGTTSEQARFDWTTASQLNPRYQFDGFVAGTGQPVCAGRGDGGGGTAFEGLQPAVSVWRRGHGQDAPDACHRP